MKQTGILTNSEIKILFSNILELIAINKEMYKLLTDRKIETIDAPADLWTIVVGDTFTVMVRFPPQHVLGTP